MNIFLLNVLPKPIKRRIIILSNLNYYLLRGVQKNIYWIVEFALEQGADPCAFSRWPLEQMVKTADLPVAKLLVDKAPDEYTYIAWRTFSFSRVDILAMLVKSGREVFTPELSLEYLRPGNGPDILKFTSCVAENCLPQHLDAYFEKLCRRGMLKPVKLLVQKGVDPTANNNVAICTAAECGHLKLVEFLISKNADPCAQNNWPIVRASTLGNIKMVKLLLANGENQDNIMDCIIGHRRARFDSYCESIGLECEKNEHDLMYACCYGDLESVRELLKIVPVNSEILTRVCAKGRLNVLKLLIENGLNVSKIRIDTVSEAYYGGHVKILKFLEKNGHNFKNCSYLLNTYTNSPFCVKFVIDRYGDDLAEDSGGFLSRVCRNGLLDIVKLLVSAVPNKVAYVNPNNRRPITQAVAGGHLETMLYLIEQKAIIDKPELIRIAGIHRSFNILAYLLC